MTKAARCFVLLATAVTLYAQGPDSSVPQAEPVSPSPVVNAASQPDLSPYRFEFGGNGFRYGTGGSWWRGFGSTLWIRKSRKFVPAFSFDSRTTDFSTQRNFSFFSYANWTSNVFTTQGISRSPVANGTQLFPSFRYDLKAWFKLPPRRRLVAGIGVTGYMLNAGQGGVIVNPGALYYRGSLVFDAEAFANRAEPGGLWSGSGLFALQQGREGKHWAGFSVAAGRQVYRALQNSPLDVHFSSFSADAFYRRWLGRRFGIVVNASYQSGTGDFHQFGIASRLFVEF